MGFRDNLFFRYIMNKINKTEKGNGSPKYETIDENKIENRFSSFRTRFISTICMIVCFLAIVYLGHVPLMILVFVIEWMMVGELFNLARESQNEKKLPLFRAQQWYFFAVAAFFFYLRFIKNNLLIEITSDAKLSSLFSCLLIKHSLISYSLYTAGFISFVLSLKKNMYLYQFGQYAWTHMIIMVVFVPSSFLISNIFQGIVWFLLPCSLIIINDIAAYTGGILFGKTPLIKLSPKKTWEGFLFGFLVTFSLSFFLARYMSKYDWLVCPRMDLSMGWLECERNEVFIPVDYSIDDIYSIIPHGLNKYIKIFEHYLPFNNIFHSNIKSFKIEPMLFHAAILSIFASVISPFGGFFASGFKRAFKVKDFAGIIPGHGGMTDRMDCQTLMAMFSYLYYFAFIRKPEIDVPTVLEIILKLDAQKQIEIFGKLGNYLLGKDLIPDSLSNMLEEINHRNYHVHD